MKKPDDEQRKLAEATEKQLELPPGLLQRYLDNGGQIDAKARAQVLDAYGIDPKLSKRNAVDAAGLALQDALMRNNNDPAIAIAELHGGQDRSKWSKSVNDFAARVSMPPPAPRPAGRRSASGMQMQAQAGNRSASGMTAPAPQQSPPVVGETPADPVEANAQQSMMTDEEIAAVEARNALPTPAAAAPVKAAPVGAPPAGEMEAPAPLPAGAIKAAGPKTLEAYRNGTLDPAKRKMFEDLVKSGALAVPAGFQLGAAAPQGAPAQAAQAPAEEPGILDTVAGIPGRIKEAVTGEKRRTAETEAAPDWSQIPEWEDLGTLKNIAAAAASPREALQILQSNFPGMKVREDEKGNLFAFSPKAGKEFAVKPGLDFGDVVRAGAVLPIYAATAATGGLPAIMAKEALVQTGVEAAQAGSGGEFNPTDIALAAATPAVLRAGGAVKNAAGSALRRAGNAALDVVPGSTTRQAAQAAAPVASDIAGEAATTTLRDVGPTGIGGARAAAPVVDQTASQVVGDAAQAAVPQTPQDIATLVKAANAGGKGAEEARATLAKALDVNPAAVKAAEDLGVQLPADVLADSVQMRSIIGNLRSKTGTQAEADFAKSMDDAVKRVDDVMAEIGGDASPAAISDRVLSTLQTARGDLKAQAQKLYDNVDAVIKPASPVTLETVDGVLKQRIADLGGDVGALTAQERSLLALAEKSRVRPDLPKQGARATYEALREQKNLIGKALRREESPYGSMDERVLKRLYGALADDQLANIERLGGAELRQQARLANQLTAKQKGLEERLVRVFGKEGDGSIANLLQGALSSASKGNVKRLNDVLKVVPKEMQGEALMTAISSLARAKGGASAGGFGFAEFASLYRGLRAKGNEQVYGQIEKAIGSDRAKVLRDVYEISKRITDARAAVKTTGKANQDFMENLAAENLVGAIVNGPMGKRAAQGAGAAIGAAVGGLPGAAVGGEVAQAILARVATGGQEQIAKAGALFTSPDFQQLAVKVATGGAEAPAVKEAVRKVALSKPFRDWWKAAQGASMKYDPKGAERWILAAMQAAQSEREQ
jgi:hypothetical protein